MPRQGYVSITLKRETWEKLQQLKLYLGATTYDELVDKLYSVLINAGLVELSKKLDKIAEQLQSLSREVERVYELERLVDNLVAELESVKTQLSKLTAKVETLERRGHGGKT